MKIGVFTFWTSKDNYGQTLQSFALQFYLNRIMNIQAEVIRYYAHKLPIYIMVKIWLKQYLLKLFPFIDRNLYKSHQMEAMRNFKQFKRNNIRYSSRILYGKKDLNRYCNQYDVLITGSDQVWSMMLDNPDNTVYYLDFGTKKQKRISYAASFGTNSYPKELKYNLVQQLSRLDFISVREEDGMAICKDCGMLSTHVLDPTFLLDKNIYEKFLVNKVRNPYVYIYILNILDSDEIDWLNLRQQITTKNIIGTNGTGYTSANVVLEGVDYENSTIEQWISNIAFAECIITTSFHGVVFSIIFERNFVFIPLKGAYSQSNNRVTSLLKQLGLEDRILDDTHKLKNILVNNIDYYSVRKTLNILKTNSIDYINKSLKIN